MIATASVDGGEVYRAGKGYTELCSYLSPEIVNWARNEWPDAPTFIRLNADRYIAEKPPQKLWESAMVPANPGWFSNFSLRKGMTEFASYQLLDRPISDGQAEYWDYHVKKVRRLEVRVERREDNYLTMMIEELPVPYPNSDGASNDKDRTCQRYLQAGIPLRDGRRFARKRVQQDHRQGGASRV
ncbi:hypothetical protein [Agrobacterium sp. Ap1]|uniref:hypothetical protein n=1 Tax=Agrobacterium sp. Ap1 TaxID=2815337 RepID=UPI00336BFC91